MQLPLLTLPLALILLYSALCFAFFFYAFLLFFFSSTCTLLFLCVFSPFFSILFHFMLLLSLGRRLNCAFPAMFDRSSCSLLLPSPLTRAACSVVVSIVIDILMPCNCLRQMPKPKPLLGNSCQQFARQTNRNSNRNTHTHTHTSCTLSLAPLTSCPLPPSFCVSAQHYKQLKTALQALNSHLCIACPQMRISFCVCVSVYVCFCAGMRVN